MAPLSQAGPIEHPSYDSLFPSQLPFANDFPLSAPRASPSPVPSLSDTSISSAASPSHVPSHTPSHTFSPSPVQSSSSVPSAPSVSLLPSPGSLPDLKVLPLGLRILYVCHLPQKGPQLSILNPLPPKAFRSPLNLLPFIPCLHPLISPLFLLLMSCHL